ncbi:MAG: hypothetical protein IPM48_13455 [Saprospiraceae bacterium]|nr:hypothetical protein [Saprospiraceae bacterium]
MKFKLTDNQVRLRLKLEEVEHLKDYGILTLNVSFGLNQSDYLKVSIVIYGENKASCRFQNNHFRVFIPEPRWTKPLNNQIDLFKGLIEQTQDQFTELIIEQDLPCDHNSKHIN